MNNKFILLTLFFCFIARVNAQDWDQLVKIVAEDRAASDAFGFSVAINGDYAIIGAYQQDLDANGENLISNAGAAYIFKKEEGTWVQQQKIVASDRSISSFFGHSVAIEGDYAIVGAYNERYDANGESFLGGAGAAYIFKREGNSWTEQQKIVSSDRFENDNFGHSVAISEDFAVVGAIHEDEDINGFNILQSAGSAYIFKRNGNLWTQQQKVVASDRTANGWFGHSVAISGTYIAIGHPGQNGNTNYTGAVHVFKLDGDGWLEQQRLVATDGAVGDRLGFSLDIDGEYIIAGAYEEDEDMNNMNTFSGAGSAYIFKRDAEIWAQQQKIVSSDRAANDRFGYSVAIDGVYAISGAYYEDEDVNGENRLNNAGSAYIFKRSGTDWTEQQKIVASDRQAADWFGRNVNIDGKFALVGAHSEDHDVNGENTLSNSGSAYIFELDCSYLVPIVETSYEVCSGGNILLTASTEFGIIRWYNSIDAAEPVWTGNEFETPVLTESTSFWVEVEDVPCIANRIEVVVNVNPLPVLTVEIASTSVCSGETAVLNAVSEGNTIKWYNTVDATEPVFTGISYETPALTETTTYWVEAENETGCKSGRTEVTVTVNPLPVLQIETASAEICSGTTVELSVSSEGNAIHWYDSADAVTPVFSGEDFETPELTETTSYWVEAESEAGCKSERVEITITILPLPELTLDIPEFICSGTVAELYGYSAGNVVFWYANEDDEEYLYHGNLFVTEELTETTTFWVEAFNLSTSCFSERIEVTVTVNPIPDAPIAVSYQTVEEGTTLADLDVEAEGALTWYANEALTVVLPETTLVEENTIYYATQTVAGCESPATEVSVEFLGLSDINGNSFDVYPNPTQGIVKIQSKLTVSSIEVFNISGQKITSVKASSEVNLSGYPSGTYVLRVVLENGEVLTRKLIKK